jgi:hypothetical protein
MERKVCMIYKLFLIFELNIHNFFYLNKIEEQEGIEFI